MAYRAYQPDRRKRRRRWLLIVLTLVIVVAGIAFLVSRQTEQRGTADFFAAADEAAALSTSAADLFQDTLADVGPLLTRQELTRRLADMSATAAQARDLLEIEVPSSIAVPFGYLSTGLSSWATGTAEAERVILGIMDAEIITDATQQLQASFDLLRVGDTAYELFVEAVDALPEDVERPEFDSITYIDPDPADPTLYDAQNLVLTMQSAYDLAPRRDVGVVGMVDPAPTGDRGGIPVVPFSEAIGINAIVTNHGNEPAESVAVELEVLNVDTVESFTIQMSASDLASGASTTVPFGDLAIVPGGLYQATVSVTIDGDNRPDNDTWSMTFIWNAES